MIRFARRIVWLAGFLFTDGVRLYGVYPDTFVEDGKIVNELETEQYVALIKPFLPKNPVILEAGCHGGIDTVKLAKSWPEGYIHAFEPVEKFVGFTHRELKNHKVSNVSVYQYALAEKTGQQIFYYSNHIGAASSLLPSNPKMDDICYYQDSQLTVDCVNLDEWTAKNKVDTIDFMWLDMEGSEQYVLRSAPRTLATVKVIFTEVNFCEFRQGMTQYAELRAFLEKHGFQLYKIWGSPVWQGNALFVKKSLLKEK